MPCLINSGYQITGCKGSNSGGVAYMYISPFSSTTVFNLDVANDIVSGITNTTFYTFDLTKQTCSFVDKPTVSIENDVIAYEPEITLVVNRLTPTLRNQLKALAQTRVHIIVLDNNGYYWLFGKNNGLDLSEATAGSGTKITDRSGYELKFKGLESVPAYNVSSSTSFTKSY
jgi:hypothetical protein